MITFLVLAVVCIAAWLLLDGHPKRSLYYLLREWRVTDHRHAPPWWVRVIAWLRDEPDKMLEAVLERQEFDR